MSAFLPAASDADDLHRVSQAGLRQNCERRPTGSSREVEANFGDVSSTWSGPSSLPLCHFKLLLDKLDGRTEERKNTNSLFVRTQPHCGFWPAAGDQLSSPFGTGAERALRQTTAGLLLL